MKSITPVHIKLEYKEALIGKREILSSKIALKKITSISKNYHRLRKIELALKLKVARKIKEVKMNLIKIEKKLPKPTLPKILKKNEYDYIRKETTTHIKEIKKDDSYLERQLAEIQARLRELQ